MKVNLDLDDLMTLLNIVPPQASWRPTLGSLSQGEATGDETRLTLMAAFMRMGERGLADIDIDLTPAQLTLLDSCVTTTLNLYGFTPLHTSHLAIAQKVWGGLLREYGSLVSPSLMPSLSEEPVSEEELARRRSVLGAVDEIIRGGE